MATTLLPLYSLARSFAEVNTKSEERPRVPPDQVLPEATIRWGKPSDFSVEEYKDFVEGEGFSVRVEDDEPEPERERIKLQEEGRTWVDHRVENPDDPEQYVILRTAATWAISAPPIIVWRGPVGKRQKYTVSEAQFSIILNPAAGLPPGSTSEEGEGQEPLAPPSLDEI